MMHRGSATARRARASLVVAVLVFFGLTSVGVASASASEADTIAALVNQARASAGLPGLIHNPAMDSVALQWADQMGAAQSMTHNPSYSSQIPAGWTRAGENVAMGQPTPLDMHTAWMNSAGHRANILGDFTDVGIAFVTVNGTTWGVEDFGKYPGHAGTPAPAPAPAVAAPAPAATAAAPVASAAVPAAPPTAATPTAVTPTAVTPTTATPGAAPSASPAPVAHPRRVTSATPAVYVSATPRSESMLLSVSTSAAQKPFPIGYVIGGILVILGIGGGIYGQRMRIRGRRPPGS